MRRKVVLAGDDWQLEQPMTTGLSWHRFVVPPGNAGDARLSVDGTILGSFTVLDRPRLFVQPEVDLEIGALLPDVATLIGVSLDRDDLHNRLAATDHAGMATDQSSRNGLHRLCAIAQPRWSSAGAK